MLKTPQAILFSLVILLSGCDNSSIKHIKPLPSTSTNIIQDQWTEHQGIKAKHWESDNQNYYALIFDPAKFDLQIVENPSDEKNRKSLEDIHREQNAVVSLNGSFYSEEFQPTGLLISQNKTLFPLIKADLLNGIFAISQDHQPKLLTYDQYKKTSPKLNFAIQNGPILIDDQGKIAIEERSTKTANRTAIGLTKDSQIILIFCRNSILNQSDAPTLYQFANTILNSPELKDLKIHSLLNLDGGPSTSFALANEVYPEQFEKVENIIIVKPRNDA